MGLPLESEEPRPLVGSRTFIIASNLLWESSNQFDFQPTQMVAKEIYNDKVNPASEGILHLLRLNHRLTSVGQNL